jgi:hypothetical protein
MLGVPLGFDFILYKHGPFSFDLRDELTAMRADNIIKLEPQFRYGPRLANGERGEYIQQSFSRTLAKYENCIFFVAEKLGGKGVAELERLATAFFVTESLGEDSPVTERAQELNRLKPHISEESAAFAIEEIDKIKQEAVGCLTY